MIRQALASLRAAQRNLLASKATYRRGSDETAVSVVVGKTVFRTTNEYGLWTHTAARDFIIPAGELTLVPETGDVIVFDGGEYEVLAPAGEPVWRWSDPYRSALRIHTKHIGDEA